MPGRRLGHQAHHFRPGGQHVGQHGVAGGHAPRFTGGPEGHQRGGGQRQLARRGAGEELGVFGVGPGPTSLDVLHAQVVELLGHPQLVGHGERQTLGLAAVAQRGVVDLDAASYGGVS